MADEGIKRLIELSVNAGPAIAELQKLNFATQANRTESLWTPCKWRLRDPELEGAQKRLQGRLACERPRQAVRHREPARHDAEEMDLAKLAQVARRWQAWVSRSCRNCSSPSSWVPAWTLPKGQHRCAGKSSGGNPGGHLESNKTSRRCRADRVQRMGIGEGMDLERRPRQGGRMASQRHRTGINKARMKIRDCSEEKGAIMMVVP